MGLRRPPVQERSRKRLAAILDAAETLIAAAGTDAVTMAAVAAHAGVPIGAVYHFFENKVALVEHLLERHLAAMESQPAILALGSGESATREELAGAAASGLWATYTYLSEHRIFQELWQAGQAHRQVRALDLADSRAFAAQLVPILRRLHPDRSDEALHTQALVLCHLTGSAGRLAVDVGPKESEAVFRSFVEMALRHMGFDDDAVGAAMTRLGGAS
jgi:AcrR family transcriptional regulator